MGVPVFEHNGIVCFGAILKERVRLTLAAGASLPDSQKLYNAMLNGKSRAIDFYEGDKPNATAILALIRAGVKRNLAMVKPTKARKREAGHVRLADYTHPTDSQGANCGPPLGLPVSLRFRTSSDENPWTAWSTAGRCSQHADPEEVSPSSRGVAGS